MSYEDFIRSKLIQSQPSGFKISREDLNESMYEYQKDLVSRSLQLGKSAIFSMTGTGKTIMELSWADQIPGKVLGFAPLAVAKQTVNEGLKYGINVHYTRDGSDIKNGINITNYEMMHKFNPQDFKGIFLDESSIIKHHDSKTKQAIMEFSKNIPYRLALTATPSPNDFVELGCHAEFLGVMSYSEMLATFFVNDSSSGQGWRLKGHAKEEFWKWLSTWAIFLNKPSDLGYSDDGFILPQLNTIKHIVESVASEGFLFPMGAQGLSGRRSARRDSMDDRVNICAEIVKKSRKPFLVWCDLNQESEDLVRAIPGSIEVAGKHSSEYKEQKMLDFQSGKIDVLVSKPSICGMGMNFQNCADMAFVGFSDSFELMFQATRRCYRHGQTRDVNRHIIYSEAEGNVRKNLIRKEKQFMELIDNMTRQTRLTRMHDIKQLHNETIEYVDRKFILPEWIVEGGY
jgi:hypothetical protein